MTPAVPILPYQRTVLESRATLIAWLASRRIGKSFAASLRMVLRALGVIGGKPRSQYVFAPGARQSSRLLEDCMVHLRAMEKARGAQLIASHSVTKIVLVNGREILALPNNVRSTRGYGGDVVLEEAGAIPNAAELFRAARPIADPSIGNPYGGTVIAIGTGLGDDSWFHDVMEVDPEGVWEKHRTRYVDALADGFPGKPADVMRREVGEDMWATEYDCRWITSGGQYIPGDIIDAVLYDQAPPNLRPCAAGMDVARTRHLSAVVEAARASGPILWVTGTRTERDMPWADQEAWAGDVIDRCGRLAVDRSGLGSQFTERLQSIHGESRVIGVTFSAPVKADLATGLKLAIERQQLRIPAGDIDLRRSLLTLRRHVTAAGNLVFDAEEHDDTGHGDLAWAAALAVLAAGGAARDVGRAPSVTTESRYSDRRRPFSRPRNVWGSMQGRDRKR